MSVENRFIGQSNQKLDCASNLTRNGDIVNCTHQQVRFLRPLHDCMIQDVHLCICVYLCVFVCVCVSLGKLGFLKFCGGSEDGVGN